ncbi:MAG: ATP-binding protein [Tunicatimonas sp.]|uniref:ATP-binding protein n=1 Tax=Tunicatimonas sp. TaxID=1940096 RepID=UPI003C77B63C
MPQSSETLIKNVKQYFEQNVHDTKNLFHSLNLWLNTSGQDEKKDKMQFLLQELEGTYLTKITELRDEFNQFLVVKTESTRVTKLDPLAHWLTDRLDSYWTQYGVSGELIKEFDDSISLSYPVPYLRSMVRSLLDNTVLYQSEDRDLVVRVTLAQKDSTVLLQIEDNGIGIDMDRHRDALFQPFRRFSSRGEGKGLSLHLIKTMVEKNGGKIELMSYFGKGTSITLFLESYD